MKIRLEHIDHGERDGDHGYLDEKTGDINHSHILMWNSSLQDCKEQSVCKSVCGMC